MSTPTNPHPLMNQRPVLLLLLLIVLLCFQANLLAAAPAKAAHTQKAKLSIVANYSGALVFLNKQKIAQISEDGLAHAWIEPGQYELYVEKTIQNTPFAYRTLHTLTAKADSHIQLDLKLTYGFSRAGKKQWQSNPRDVTKQALKNIEMIDIPGGSFLMGSQENNDELPQHTVNIPAFKMARFETTFNLYDLYVLDTAQELPEDNNWGRNTHPVINVSWQDVQKFLTWLNKMVEPGKPYRLPSEAEWEYAARGGTTSVYWWGKDKGKNMANCDGCGSLWDDKSTAPVGSFQDNPFGLMDTAGNVYEWVQDCWNHNYDGAPTDGSAWLNEPCSRRVVRGGSWSYFPRYMHSSDRDYSYEDYRSSNDGFRLAQ